MCIILLCNIPEVSKVKQNWMWQEFTLHTVYTTFIKIWKSLRHSEYGTPWSYLHGLLGVKLHFNIYECTCPFHLLNFCTAQATPNNVCTRISYIQVLLSCRPMRLRKYKVCFQTQEGGRLSFIYLVSEKSSEY